MPLIIECPKAINAPSNMNLLFASLEDSAFFVLFAYMYNE